MTPTEAEGEKVALSRRLRREYDRRASNVGPADEDEALFLSDVIDAAILIATRPRQLAEAHVKANRLDEIAEQLSIRGYPHYANAVALRGLVNDLESAQAQLAEARAERERMREALDEIALLQPTVPCLDDINSHRRDSDDVLIEYGQRIGMRVASVLANRALYPPRDDRGSQKPDMQTAGETDVR